MPTVIPMLDIMQTGQTLGRFGGSLLPGDISVEMYGNKMVIKQKGKQVFSMKQVSVVDNHLLIDFPKTAEGQDGRGWGILGMLIALYHGAFKNCTDIHLGSQIEQTRASMGFWSKFGIARMEGTPLQFAFDRGIAWVLRNCEQEDKKITNFVLR